MKNVNICVKVEKKKTTVHNGVQPTFVMMLNHFHHVLQLNMNGNDPNVMLTPHSGT